MMDYKPATALVTSYRNGGSENQAHVLIQPQDVPGLLGKIAELIGGRASRLINREVRLAGLS